MATITCCFNIPAAGFDQSVSFKVQVVGVDPAGAGVYHSSFNSALDYATQANSNGFTCFIHLV